MPSSYGLLATPIHDVRPTARSLPRRLMFLLLAAAFAMIILFSRHPLLAKHTGDILGLHLTRPPQNTPFLHSPNPPQNTPLEPVVFSLIIVSEYSAKEGAIMLKSAIMYATRPLQFHIICDREAIAYLEPRFRLLTHPLHPITVRFYLIAQQSMLDRIAREGSLDTGHAAGVPGLMKLFIHEVLPDDVEKAIYVDTDAFFLTDPALLWEEFSHWKPNVAVSMPYHPDIIHPHWFNATKICSCIMLLDLQKLRSIRLMDSDVYRRDRSGLYPPAFSPPLFEALFGPPGSRGYHAELGDQTFWWAIVGKRPDIFHSLPYDWEVSSCVVDMYMTGLGSDAATEEEERKAMIHLEDTPFEGTVVLPKLVHFNCLDDVRIYYTWTDSSNPSLSKRWRPAVDYHVGFKWLWLNRGRSESWVDIHVVTDPLFADQRFALEHLNELQADS